MSNLQEKEKERKAIIGSIVEDSVLVDTIQQSDKGRPKEERELKKRISLSVLPSLYKDIQKIAFVQRKNVSELMSELMERYRAENAKVLADYDELK